MPHEQAAAEAAADRRQAASATAAEQAHPATDDARRWQGWGKPNVTTVPNPGAKPKPPPPEPPKPESK